MGIISKDLYTCIKDKEVEIREKSFGTPGVEHKSTVIGYCFGQGTEMFLELDNGELINTKYIASIKVIR